MLKADSYSVKAQAFSKNRRKMKTLVLLLTLGAVAVAQKAPPGRYKRGEDESPSRDLSLPASSPLEGYAGGETVLQGRQHPGEEKWGEDADAEMRKHPTDLPCWNALELQQEFHTEMEKS